MCASATSLSSDDPGSVPNTSLRDPTGSIAPHVILMVLQLLALAGPPLPYRRGILIVITLSLGATYLSRPHFTNSFGLAQPFSMLWSTYLSSLEKLAARGGPEASFWRIDQPARDALAYPSFGLKKLRWALVLIFNMRGIRWNYQVKNVPAASKMAVRGSRPRFLAWQAAALAYYVFMADLVSQLGIHIFYMGPDGRVGAVNTKYLTLRSPYLRLSFTKALVFGATPYYIVQLQYTLFSILAVLLMMSKPEVSGHRRPIGHQLSCCEHV